MASSTLDALPDGDCRPYIYGDKGEHRGPSGAWGLHPPAGGVLARHPARVAGQLENRPRNRGLELDKMACDVVGDLPRVEQAGDVALTETWLGMIPPFGVSWEF